MTDPRTLQRQLIHATERADELEASLERIAKLCAPLLVLESHAHDVRVDELIAHAHGGPKPALTAGAQARLFRHTQETKP